MLVLVMATASGGSAAMRLAKAIASASAWPSATTFSTRPHSRASIAAMRSAARITACLVRAGPISANSRGSEPQLMFMPSATSGMRKCAPSAQKRKSSAAASATPPPMQGPSMAAIVTCSMSHQARHIRGPTLSAARRSPSPSLARDRPSASLRSKPAENTCALPVRITTEVPRSSSKACAAALSCRIASGESALSLSPRSKRTMAIRPSGPSPFSTLTNVPVMRRSSPAVAAAAGMQPGSRARRRGSAPR
jgi:hypothetical protein